MATSNDLTGVGVPPIFANLIATDPVNITAAGTTQATATVARGELIEFTPTGSDGVMVPDPGIGNPVFAFNSSASTGLVYVPVGHTLNTTLNGSVSVATHKGVLLIQYKRLFWFSILTA
jgi:hypothetical protein